MATAIRTRIFMSFLHRVNDWLESRDQNCRHSGDENAPPLYEGGKGWVGQFRGWVQTDELHACQLTIFLRTRFAPLRNPCAL